MSEFIHSVLAQNESISANTVITYDLPVNPLSFIIATIKFQQDSANTQVAFGSILAMISKIEVLYKGSAIYSSSGVDLMGINGCLLGFEPWTQNANGDDDDYRSISFIVPMGRRMYDPRECFPRSTRGELLLQITYASSFTDIDGAYAQFETVELPDATPERYCRITTLSVTPTATGELDVELPIGHTLAAVMFWGTTKPTDDSDTKTLQYGQLLIDNQRRYFSMTNYESWRQLAAIRNRPLISQAYHIHQLDAAAYAQYMDTQAVKYVNDMCGPQLIWDFDPLRDGTYLLDTRGASDLVARIYAGDTNALRVLPVELIGSSEGM